MLSVVQNWQNSNRGGRPGFEPAIFWDPELTPTTLGKHRPQVTVPSIVFPAHIYTQKRSTIPARVENCPQAVL